jgi:hypothetical protein
MPKKRTIIDLIREIDYKDNIEYNSFELLKKKRINKHTCELIIKHKIEMINNPLDKHILSRSKYKREASYNYQMEYVKGYDFLACYNAIMKDFCIEHDITENQLKIMMCLLPYQVFKQEYAVYVLKANSFDADYGFDDSELIKQIIILNQKEILIGLKRKVYVNHNVNCVYLFSEKGVSMVKQFYHNLANSKMFIDEKKITENKHDLLTEKIMKKLDKLYK